MQPAPQPQQQPMPTQTQTQTPTPMPTPTSTQTQTQTRSRKGIRDKVNERHVQLGAAPSSPHAGPSTSHGAASPEGAHPVLQQLAQEIASAWVEQEAQDTDAAMDIGRVHAATESLAQDALASKRFSVPLFAELMRACSLSPEQLYRHYVGKNVLNFFRQDHGYQEGTYVKLWQGRAPCGVSAFSLTRKSTQRIQQFCWCAIKRPAFPVSSARGSLFGCVATNLWSKNE